MPRRAALTLILLFETLVIAILGVVPGQSPVALGCGVPECGRGGVAVRHRGVGDRGAGLVAGSGGGLHWLLPAIVLLLGVGVMNAWIMLIEILR